MRTYMKKNDPMPRPKPNSSMPPGRAPFAHTAPSVSPRFGHDFSQIPLSDTAPVSPTAPRVTPPTSPPPAPAPTPSCTITTRTSAKAPDGTADSRTLVGVKEEVAIASSVPSAWTASDGTFTTFSDRVILWTAPVLAAKAVITATPAGGGAPCSVTMEVVPPSSRQLVKKTDRPYDAGLAGSGFEADATILPTEVSFNRIEVREEEAIGVATGYYDKVLLWNGKKHPVGAWVVPDPAVRIIRDGVGSPSPGTPGPFSKGTFEWPIPQTYRPVGSTAQPIEYSKASHFQEMLWTSGAETTTKEGAGRARRP